MSQAAPSPANNKKSEFEAAEQLKEEATRLFKDTKYD